MSEELEQDDHVKEIPAEYIAKFPPYYDRFIEERDRRISAEFSLLRNRVETNTQRINELRDLTLLRFAEAAEDRDRRFAKATKDRNHGLTEAAADHDRRFAEATEDRNHGLAEATADRDRRFAEAAKDRNRGLAETATDRVRIRQEMAQGFEAAAADRDRRFAEATEDRNRGLGEAAADRMLIRQDITQLRQQVERLEFSMESRFRWTIGLMMPVILGILAIIIRIFFGGTP